ncbi:hypothetical protein [Pseudoalteromonas sp. BMB]|uniref:hypothetical protein n=1 Tax=Pseudoalteromonas sp. BMB TaxID=1874619 RepID=UPI001112DDBE|nr:hypothetical protein [Pseudoalteromonas sp. BMB]
MSPIDSDKFYTEAFLYSYYGKEHVSTVVASGFTYKVLGFFINDQKPQLLVFINYLLHSISVVLLVKSGRLLYREAFNERLFAFFCFLSPLVFSQLSYFIKDYFSLFFAVLSFYLWVKVNEKFTFLKLVLLFLSIVLSMLFRVYAPVYILLLVISTGYLSRGYLYLTTFLSVGFISFFGLKSILFIFYGVLVVYFVPNFLNLDNFIVSPFSTLEGVVIFLVHLIIIFKITVTKDKEEAIKYFSMVMIIGLTLSLVSAFRVTYASGYDSIGNAYIADNFFRKKIPVTYILLFYFFSTKFFLRKFK